MSEACTSIVTEYKQKEASQTQRIKIEVEYFSELAIKDHIKELLWSFRRIFLPDVAGGSESMAYAIKYQTESDQAWSSLHTAFGHEKDFNIQFAKDQSDGAFERVLDQLCQWAASIPWPQGGADGKWATYAETAEECYERTGLFMRDRLWPFTKLIRCAAFTTYIAHVH